MQEGTVLSVIRRKSDKTKRRQGMRPLVFLFPLIYGSMYFGRVEKQFDFTLG